MDDRTRELVFELGFGRCMHDVEESNCCVKPATDTHHMLPNTKVNKKKYPLFINSIFNLLPVNNGCHLTKKLPGICEHEAAIYEKWLRMFKDGEIK